MLVFFYIIFKLFLSFNESLNNKLEFYYYYMLLMLSILYVRTILLLCYNIRWLLAQLNLYEDEEEEFAL